MAYSFSKSDLVPMLAKCLLKHGSLEAVKSYPAQVRNQGGDATVCAEFIALNEIMKSENPNDLIHASYEKAIQAAADALREADAKNLKSGDEESLCSSARHDKGRAWLIPSIAWLVLAGISIWLEDEGASPILLASIVVSAAYLLGIGITMRRHKEKEGE